MLLDPEPSVSSPLYRWAMIAELIDSTIPIPADGGSTELTSDLQPRISPPKVLTDDRGRSRKSPQLLALVPTAPGVYTARVIRPRGCSRAT
jgi:hypothetical protein